MGNYISTEFFIIIIIILSVSSTRYQRYHLQKNLFLMKTLLPVEIQVKTHFDIGVISFQCYFDLSVRYHSKDYFRTSMKILLIKQEKPGIGLLLWIIIVDRLAIDSIAITLIVIKIGTYFYCFARFLSQSFNKILSKKPKSRWVIVIHIEKRDPSIWSFFLKFKTFLYQLSQDLDFGGVLN